MISALASTGEKFYSAFHHRKLRPDEDPSLLLWDLEDLLAKADPDLPDEAHTALLERQFMKSLPPTVRLRLLESNPTPSLADMCAFNQHYHAVHRFSKAWHGYLLFAYFLFPFSFVTLYGHGKHRVLCMLLC